MKRTLRWMVAVTAIIAVIAFAAKIALSAWIAHKKNEYACSMHEGHLIVDEIKSHDSSIRATWDTTDDHPEVVVRNEFDPAKQDAIIAWARAVKAESRVHRLITLEFHKEIPHSHIDDTVLRTVEF